MAEILSILIGIYLGSLIYSLTSYQESFLNKRLRKTATRKKSFKETVEDRLIKIFEPLLDTTLRNEKYKTKIKNLLLRADLPSRYQDILAFENTKFLILITSLILGTLAFTIKPEIWVLDIVLVCIIIFYKMPEYRLNMYIKKKQKDFNKYFPDAIDLLAVCLEAGLSIDYAITRVGMEFKDFSPAINREFTRVSKDIASGIPRKEALQELGKRVNSKDLQSFTAFLIQSEKLGTSVAQVLYTYCDTLRSKKRQRIEELVQTASVKMTIPMVFFLLPALFLILMYPAIIKVMENMH